MRKFPILLMVLPLVLTAVLLAVVPPAAAAVVSSACLELPAGKDEANNYNAAVAARYVDGTVIQSGEEFSFNAVVGPRTEERGFIWGHNAAGSPDLGGGICRTSTVLYQAALNAGLAVTERYPHTPPVDYTPEGTDAAVQWGMCDFRFLNTLAVPLEVSAALEVYGEKYVLWAVFRSVETVEQPVSVSVAGSVYEGVIIRSRTYLPASTVNAFCGTGYLIDKVNGLYSVRVGNLVLVESDSAVVPADSGVFVQLRKLAELSGVSLKWVPPDKVFWVKG